MRCLFTLLELDDEISGSGRRWHREYSVGDVPEPIGLIPEPYTGNARSEQESEKREDMVPELFEKTI